MDVDSDPSPLIDMSLDEIAAQEPDSNRGGRGGRGAGRGRARGRGRGAPRGRGGFPRGGGAPRGGFAPFRPTFSGGRGVPRGRGGFERGRARGRGIAPFRNYSLQTAGADQTTAPESNNFSFKSRAVMDQEDSGPAIVMPVAAGSAQMWKHDRFSGYAEKKSERDIFSRLTPNSAGEPGGAKLLISNLRFDVNENDLKELFQEFGTLSHVQIKYDRSGRSLGEAEVTFLRKADAVTAQKARNGDKIDGQAMEITLLVINTANSSSNNPSYFVKRRTYENGFEEDSWGSPRGRRGGRGAYRGGRGRGERPRSEQ
eukprot:TRINITY_DN974_c0_g1_i1.p1 TRINITY_DN974_c0_g1~~TRINITY_DN974_c0_g1_i1.p1  ORF type:complete len:313 (+),score=68.25 TRINITY_DN974_c0_g1_i1:67-1005(+)